MALILAVQSPLYAERKMGQSYGNPCWTTPRGVLQVGHVSFLRDDATDVDVVFDEQGLAAIEIAFSERGTRKLGAAQQGKVGARLPVCLGTQLLTNPILNETIQGNTLHISGPDLAEAQRLSHRLKAYFNLNEK
ncbi:SecDF P1 head subdomain-containing protein [Sphingorhabdus sp.]|jgi:preprotein translocase subunit SecD|nr:hypothetical protein [Sphingomonadales bacterium]